MVARRRTIWVQQVAVDASVLQTRLEVARAGTLTPAQRAAADGVQVFLDRARSAADRTDPVPGRLVNWWRGVLVEAAYRNTHAARAQLVDLYDEADVDAELPGAVARVHTVLGRDDPRLVSQTAIHRLGLAQKRAWLRRLIEDGYEAADLKHAQLRSFRNILLMAAAVTILLVGLTVALVSLNPAIMPLCFPHDASGAAAGAATRFNCPTRSDTAGPSGGDVGVVGLLGLLGGALAASVAIRNIRGTSTPYDVPVALAWLKVPLGAFTAILGLVAVQGGFVPGLSALDSQEQILAWALLLGFGQQVFTGVLDRRAQSLLDDVPSKDALTEHPAATAPGPIGPADATDVPDGVRPVPPPPAG